jgi:hypothetical protein
MLLATEQLSFAVMYVVICGPKLDPLLRASSRSPKPPLYIGIVVEKIVVPPGDPKFH